MNDLAVQSIREQMASIRSLARSHAGRLGEETRQFLDWKHYVRLFPWGAVALAAAAGYFLVPRRIVVTHPDPDTLARLAREQRLVVAPADTQRKRPGLIESALQLMGNTLLRAGIAYAGQQVGRLLAGPVPQNFESGDRRYASSRP